jgi:hypothetical protein
MDAVTVVLCSYHFPKCEKDNLFSNQICFDACLNMFNRCRTGSGATAVNISLAHFASIGDRCNFWGIYNPSAPDDKPYFNERAYKDANRMCTVASADTSFGCFAASSSVLVRNFSQQVLRGTPNPNPKPQNPDRKSQTLNPKSYTLPASLAWCANLWPTPDPRP